LAQSGLPLSSVGKKKALTKGVSKQRSAKIKKVCTETDKSSWQLRPTLQNVANATTVQNQIAMSVNVQPATSTIIMPITRWLVHLHSHSHNKDQLFSLLHQLLLY